MSLKLSNAYTDIEFCVENENVSIQTLSFFGKQQVNSKSKGTHSCVFLTGGAYFARHFDRNAVLGEKFTFVDSKLVQEIDKQKLIITEQSERLLVRSVYTLYKEFATLCVYKEVENISKEDIQIEGVSPLTLFGVMDEDKKLPNLWKGYNTHCSEAMFEKTDLNAEGFRGFARAEVERKGKYSVTSNGTQTTKQYLPMGILEKEGQGLLYFELSPEAGWHYELEFERGEFALCLTGKTFADNGWYKVLKAGETYRTESVRVVGGESLDCILEHMTKYRREVRLPCKHDVPSKVIYNNFMENTYDHPTEDMDASCSDEVAKYGADYYVIDAGWHDKGIGHSPTHEIGEWKENLVNYPSGLKKTTEAIKAKGMKLGLWVEVQSVGIYCNKDAYPEDCFFHVNGRRPGCNCRYQLDFTKAETRARADAIIADMVSTYGPAYIKIDYNQTAMGNDCESGSIVEGAVQHVKAYREWYKAIQEKYPDVLFESCASGGMCMDADSSAQAAVISFSDMPTYFTVPYAIANQPMAILPEQTGVWCMPVRKFRERQTTDEQVIINMVNSFYYVIHLATRLEYLSDVQKELLKEGLAYYRSLAVAKKTALPVMPRGFTSVSDEVVCTGMKTSEKLYLSWYHMSDGACEVVEDLRRYGAKSAKLVYPKNAANEYSIQDGIFRCKMQGESARAFEFEIEK